uniref:Uncharacterized protein n=1 Tax=Siphoviridae sp. ctJ3t72 TaxID=2826240 RepID=A0A8S5QNG6_9CAUD|nr:MAG TPA: hypothetical protein [Siphoviridae sp. ctJ3t72]
MQTGSRLFVSLKSTTLSTMRLTFSNAGQSISSTDI